MDKKILLEVGKTYLNLVGGRITIVSVSSDGSIFKDAEGIPYFKNGGYYNCDRTSWDLWKEAE